jgi:membrane protein DedA with SNARE-associated domain
LGHASAVWMNSYLKRAIFVLMTASIVSVAQNIGYPALFLLIMAESGGMPVPGETALITGGVLASQGRLEIGVVIALAAAAAIIGDNFGYVIGREGGRRLLQRPGRFENRRRQVLEVGEPFFDRHGPKAVFFGRWLPGLRIWASWLAGATRMHRPSFTLWNAAGGIGWATSIGLLAFFVGHRAGGAVSAVGMIGVVVALVAIAGALLLRRISNHRQAIAWPPADTPPTVVDGRVPGPTDNFPL